ncbi:Cyclic di-GMP phosphodiesterase YahA [Thiorhodovibrio winogradskyi]|uniref:Cyclic di-GMP phosphodiesterase YahA n=1 Tax=Thiorhodovibrio winogradskyi TaxID=77007 RepID=A0ABZ0S6I1_9GAMM|nr:EAL domain-containing protein [Thiorhodovibrio winogradskyi]
MRVLCLDDDPRMARVLTRMIGALGHECRFCSSLPEFKASAMLWLPDLLVLDLGLGQHTGLDVIAWLTRLPVAPPVLLASGFGTDVMDTARRFARDSGLQVIGQVSKANLAKELPEALRADWPSTSQPSTKTTLDTPISVELLRDRIFAGAIEPRFQPIVDLQTGHIRGVEVLSRLRLADGGLLPPSRFIPLAESSGLISALTQALIARLIEMSARLDALSVQHLGLNLSWNSLNAGEAEALISPLVSALADGCHLDIELTETVSPANLQMLRRTGAELRLLGARIAIDDFGTGYSSVRNLAELPVDVLKIDMSFVREMFDSAKGLAILRGIIHLGHDIGLELIAEGVENQDQRQALVKAGVGYAQGFLFHPPMSLSHLEEVQGPPSRVQPASVGAALSRVLAA